MLPLSAYFIRRPKMKSPVRDERDGRDGRIFGVYFTMAEASVGGGLNLFTPGTSVIHIPSKIPAFSGFVAIWRRQ